MPKKITYIGFIEQTRWQVTDRQTDFSFTLCEGGYKYKVNTAKNYRNKYFPKNQRNKQRPKYVRINIAPKQTWLVIGMNTAQK